MGKKGDVGFMKKKMFDW